MILTLLACGAGAPLDQPLPPPEPAPQLTSADPDVVEQSGLVSEVHGPTRTFILTGEGRRSVVFLGDTGTLMLGGQPSLVEALQPGTTLWVEGKRYGDLLVTLRASDGTAAVLPLLVPRPPDSPFAEPSPGAAVAAPEAPVLPAPDAAPPVSPEPAPVTTP